MHTCCACSCRRQACISRPAAVARTLDTRVLMKSCVDVPRHVFACIWSCPCGVCPGEGVTRSKANGHVPRYATAQLKFLNQRSQGGSGSTTQRHPNSPAEATEKSPVKNTANQPTDLELEAPRQLARQRRTHHAPDPKHPAKTRCPGSQKLRILMCTTTPTHPHRNTHAYTHPHGVQPPLVRPARPARPLPQPQPPP